MDCQSQFFQNSYKRAVTRPEMKFLELGGTSLSSMQQLYEPVKILGNPQNTSLT